MFRSIRNFFRKTEQRSIMDLTAFGGLVNIALGQVGSEAGPDITPYVALSYAPWYRAIDLISSKVAGLDLPCYRRDSKGGRSRDLDVPGEWLLNGKANDNLNAYQFRKTLTQYALSWGNGYAYIERQGRFGPPVALHLLSPMSVSVSYNYGNDLVYRIRMPNGESKDALPTDVLHIHGLAWDGVRGYPAWLLARNTIGLGKATEAFGSSFFRRGATHNGILELPQGLSDKAMTEAREAWQKYQGLENAQGTAVLKNGVQWKSNGVTQEAAQYLGTRTFTAKEVGVFFGCPSHFLGDDGDKSLASLEILNQNLLDNCLAPWLKAWEMECNDKLLTDEEHRSRDAFFEHDSTKLLYMDPKKRVDMFSIGLQYQIFTPNEVRDQLGMPPREGGDEPWQPTQKVAMGSPDAAPDAKPDAPPEPDATPPADEGRAGADRSQLVAAFRSMFEVQSRRMIRRLTHSVPRAAKKPDQFLKSLDEIMAEQGPTMREVFRPLLNAANLLVIPSKITAVDDYLQLCQRELLELAGSCSAEQLTSAIATWAGDLERRHIPLLVESLIGADDAT